MPFEYPSQSGYSQSPQSVPAIASRTSLKSSSFGKVCASGGPCVSAGSGAPAGAPIAALPPGAGSAGGAGSWPVFRVTMIVSSIPFESAPPGAHLSGAQSLPSEIAFEYPKQSGYPQSPQSVPAIASSSTFCNFGWSPLTASARAASCRPIAAGSRAPFFASAPFGLSASSCSLVGKGGGGASQAAMRRRVISPSGLRGKLSDPLGGLYGTAGTSGSGTKRSTRLLKNWTEPSNSRVCWMAPVGQGSTQSPQYMHLPMSMSNRSMRSLGVVFPSPFKMSMLMTWMGQARSQAWHAVQMSMSTSRNPR